MNSKLTASNKIKSKVPEKLARAAQLLYRPVLVHLPELFLTWAGRWSPAGRIGRPGPVRPGRRGGRPAGSSLQK